MILEFNLHMNYILPNVLFCLEKLIRFFNIHFDQIDISFDSSNKFVFLEWVISIFVTDRVHLVSFNRTFLLMEVDFFQNVDLSASKLLHESVQQIIVQQFSCLELFDLFILCFDGIVRILELFHDFWKFVSRAIK